MAKYDTYLVDADDTVLDFHASSEIALRRAFGKIGEVWREEYADEFFTLNDALWKKLEKKELTRQKLHEERFPAYLERLELDAGKGAAFNGEYLSALAECPVYTDGAEEFLKKLSGAGRIYIVTNGTCSIQKSRFDIVGLWQYIKGAFISETIGCDKPGKAYTDYVLAHIPAFDRRRTVWIGDSLSADLSAAKEAKIDAIWWNPLGKSLPEDLTPRFVASDFRQILDFLQIY